jgi:hypothetical protein
MGYSYIMTVCRSSSEELLKQQNGFLIQEGYGPPSFGSRQIALTMPARYPLQPISRLSVNS